MKTQWPKRAVRNEAFLTEREQKIADQLQRLRDLQFEGDVKAGSGRTLSGMASTARTEVKDSHDR